MARIVKQLTDTEIKKTKAKEKDYKISDGKGLYIVIKKNGTKFFRFDFSFAGKRKSMSFGVYPTVSLKNARDKREDARKQIQNNINPINQKKIDKQQEVLTLNYVTEKWFQSISMKLSDQTIYNYRGSLQKNVLNRIGKKEIKNISRIEIVTVLNELHNHTNTIKRIFRLLSRIFSFAVVNYNLEQYIMDFEVTDILPSHQTINHTAITQKDDIYELINSIRNFSVKDKEYLHYSPVYALKILPYVFVRISSLLLSKWEHIDFENNTWVFPAENTKTKKEYLCPMPLQVVELLNELKKDTVIKSEYVFHSAHNNADRSLSRASVGKYLSSELGYKGKMTLHGFRSTFSTTAYENEEEHGYSSFIIEACLSHADKNRVRSAYNRESLTKYINQKKDLIQWYADFIDKKKTL
ncbi:MAG: integrase arm-type DNA-binding domain-containing protein [Arcobacteraceae bacterium]